MEVRDLVSSDLMEAVMQRPLDEFERQTLPNLAQILYSTARRVNPSLLAQAELDLGYFTDLQSAFSSAAARLVLNPRGLTYEQEGGYAYSAAAPRSDEKLYFTDSELSLIQGTDHGGQWGSFRASWGPQERDPRYDNYWKIYK